MVKYYTIKGGGPFVVYCESDENEQYTFDSVLTARMFRDLLNKWEREWSPVYLTCLSGGTETDYTVGKSSGYVFSNGSSEGYTCELFGCGNAITLHRRPGTEPNWFWRKMQFLILGNKWIKGK